MRKRVRSEEHGAPEPAGKLQIEGDVERAPLPGEIFVELARRAVEPPGRGEDARANPRGEPGQDRVVILAPERDAHEALFRRREEKRPERAVDGPIGDVEQAPPLRQSGETCVQQVLSRRARKSLRETVDDVCFGNHGL